MTTHPPEAVGPAESAPSVGWFATHRRLAGSAALGLLVLAAYWPAMLGQFVWDDALLVDRNPLVTGQLNLLSVWFQTDFPLTLAVLWGQWVLWGGHATGYHIATVALHAAGCMLLWRALVRLQLPGAWLAAALFSVHPVAATSVAWISEIKNTLSLPLYFLSLGWFLDFEEAQAGAPKTASRWYWLSLGAFLLALLAKTSTVMLPVVLLGCAGWRRRAITRRDVLRTAPFFLLALILGSLTIWFQAQVMADGEPVQAEGFAGRCAAAARALWFYLGKALLPVNLSLIYPRWTTNPAVPLAWLPAVLWAGVFALCWRFRHAWGRAALFGLGIFAVNLFPALGFFSMDYLVISRVSDHFLYLPLTALTALGAAALVRWVPGRALPWTTAALVATLAVLTCERARVIASPEVLWRDTLARNPAAWVAHNNLGCILAAQTNLPAAMKHFETALRLHPNNAGAHANLGRILSLQHQFTNAELHFQAALRIKANNVDVRQSYAAALAEQGRIPEAIGQQREAVWLRPDPAFRLRLAELHLKAGQYAEAIAQYRAALERAPDLLEALNNLGWLLATSSDASLRNGPEAVRFARRACRLDGENSARAFGTLAAACAEAGLFTEAVAAAERAVQLAEAAGDTRFAAINRQLLALYRAGKPFHEKPRTAPR